MIRGDICCAGAAAFLAACAAGEKEAVMRREPLLGTLTDTARFEAMHPLFPAVFRFLAINDLAALPAGESELDGRRLRCIVSEDAGKSKADAVLEAHRRYIDIQVLLAGAETTGWRPTPDCLDLKEPYKAEADVVLFRDEPARWVNLKPGDFAVFFPDDAHAPMVGSGPIRKLIFKVAVDPSRP